MVSWKQKQKKNKNKQKQKQTNNNTTVSSSSRGEWRIILTHVFNRFTYSLTDTYNTPMSRVRANVCMIVREIQTTSKENDNWILREIQIPRNS